ncbi:cyclase family protein [Terrabacter sp. Ter38]|uniref:cyclase family protein n=1 Tax=Terrabacter sp. Ter38 TaxID=2926030 RepID=UPI0021194769|nr:cyclase family protein [Terrabacter sp. Ter38]
MTSAATPHVAHAVDTVGLRPAPSRRRVIDLAQPLHPDIPSSPSHPGYKHALLRRHGDAVRVDGSSGANDLLVLGTHTGTHVDALSHISHKGRLHGGVDAAQAQRTGRFTAHGVETIAPDIVPGVLLDVPRALGVDRLAPGCPIDADDLEAAARLLHGGPAGIAPGAALLVRTGWAQLWHDAVAFVSHADGVPGPDASGGAWLAERLPSFVGSDTTAFEHIPAGQGHARLPVHRLMLVERGVPIIEMASLEELAAEAPASWELVVAPLPLVGATGSPLRPLALITEEEQ